MLVDNGEVSQTNEEEAQYDFDLFVIGAGSGGVRASRFSANYGAKVYNSKILNYQRHNLKLGSLFRWC